MSSPTGIQSGAQLLAPAPAPAAPMATTSSGTPLTLSTSSTTMTNSSHDPSLRRQPTPAPARAPVETRKISKTTDTNNPQWKMLNQYRVIRLLGRGTHGTVKYGEDMSKDDPKAPDYAVAIKIIKRQPNRKRLPRADGRERTNTALSRIRYEVAVMKRCNHDHIVRLIEVIDDPRSQAVFLVMEYLEGGEIKWRGPEKPLLSLGQTRRIVRDVLLGLEYLHYMGIIHRDIKPANMLWTKGRARVKLTDFGVAHFSRPLRADKSATGDNDGPYIDNDDHLYKTEGTPAFYAPEQAYNQNGLPVPKFERGKRPPGVKGDQIFPMTKALDVWAFGVSIYCFLFGRPPYWGPNVHALCHAIIEDEYVVEPFATADRLPVDGNDPDLNEALNLMKGMMTKPVHARLTLTKAKVSPWLTGDLEHPDAWLKETDPEAKDAIFISGDEPSQALTSKTNTTRISGIMRALGIRKQNSAHPKSDIRSMRGPSQISLEQSTHRHLPKPRSLYRPSADQPASPVDPASTASSPTGTSHYGESYFGRVVPPSNGKIGGLSRMVSSFFRKAKKSTSAEAIMSAPAPITPITPRMAHDISASSSPPTGMSFTPRPTEPIEQELDPLLITYSSEEDDDEDEGDVGLLGYGGFESYQPTSSGVSPSDVSRSYNVIRPFDSGARRFSTANSEPIDTPKRVYDSSYPQHTHKAREDSWIATITSTPSSPKQETVYIPSAVRHPPPPVRSRPQSDDESDDDDEVLEIRRGPRTTHTES